jgi:type I restriction enzyme M protein
MFEQAFKNIDDVLRKEAGCTTELDYTEQTSWLLFLKYLDGLEQDKADEAKLEGKRYSFILDKDYRWESWAASKGKDGKLNHNIAMTGSDLSEFVNLKLFPYLHSFKQKASGPNTIEYKIGEIFGEIKNKIQSGYNCRCRGRFGQARSDRQGLRGLSEVSVSATDRGATMKTFLEEYAD